MAETTVRALVAGNWKMNGLKSAVAEFEALRDLVGKSAPNCDVLVCPPFTLIGSAVAALSNSSITVGGQDCHTGVSGAHTGDVSAQMLGDTGATYVIVGHSERRADHGETDALVASKASAAISAGLTAIICVGETEAQRDAGQTLDIVAQQVKGSIPEGAAADTIVIAYEPVWAIGTGKTPSVADVAEVHTFIRETLTETLSTGAQVRILYGGSVKPGNAAELMAADHVNGALVGGASLKAADFNGIIDAYRV